MVDELSSALRFIAPYRTQWVTTFSLALGLLFIGFILAVLIWSEIMLFWAMGFRAIFLFSPLTCLGGLIVLVAGADELAELLWQVIGQEVLEVHVDSITLRHQILGLGITRRYTRDTLGGVVVLPHTDVGLTALHMPGVSLFSRFGLRASAFRSFQRGRIALQRGTTAVEDSVVARFGSSLEADEAQHIVASIHRKFPQYQPSAHSAG